MRPTVRIALDWAERCFGTEHVRDTRVRALRVAEEAVELAQAAQVDRHQLHELVDIVYARPVGNLRQEMGGVMMTMSVLCAVSGTDPIDEFHNELLRVLAKPAEHYTKRNEEKKGLGLR